MAVRLVDPLGPRELAAGDFPLTVGGPGAGVVLPGLAAGETVAEFLLDGASLCVRPAGTAGVVRVNGRPLADAAWLAAGDVVEIAGARFALAEDDGLVLAVTHAAVANTTLPPLLEGRPFDATGESGDSIPLTPVAYEPPRTTRQRRRTRLPAARAALWAVGLAALAVIAFLVAAGTVTVELRPQVAGAHIDFEGSPDFALGSHRLVLPGARRLRVEAQGYAPANLPVTVTGETDQRIVVALERLPGRVRFETGGVAGVLSVDGVRLGAVPGEYSLAAGTRDFLVEAPRHVPVRGRIVVRGGGLRDRTTVRLVPSYARVTVLSVPDDAVVSVGGKRAGVTPLEVDLDAGRHELVIAHPQFRPWQSSITVKPGEPLKVGPVELGLPDGTLVVRSEPAAADVSVAGRYRGRTPLTLPLAPGVGHEIVVTRAGYAPATRTVRLESRQQQVLALKLDAVLGEVTVRGEPADAELVVDGMSRGPANQSLRLPAAPHAIEVRKPGLETYRTTVTPRPALPQVVEYTLRSPEQQRVARIATTARTGLGQELRLITAGRYMMGSARREPGRRSNESQRTVELRRPFYIGTREVTNREFQEFQKEHKSGIFKQETLDLDRQPVVNVSWQQAATFCNWLSSKDGLPQAYVQKGGRLVLAEPANTGYRLPTEAEWEYVARFDGASPRLKYPWGMELPVAPRSGNYADQAATYLVPVILESYDDGHRTSASVGSFAPNALGLYDLGGNVAEWTNDLYMIYVVAPEQVTVDPTGPTEGEVHVVRGSSWMTGKVSDLRLTLRDYAAVARPDVGFRVARYAE